jgi:predicted membrane channel-forming protein YqfA (hemolysin III family)
MRLKREKINRFFEKLSDLMIYIIVVGAIIAYILNVYYPYAMGDYMLKKDYYEQHK